MLSYKCLWHLTSIQHKIDLQQKIWLNIHLTSAKKTDISRVYITTQLKDIKIWFLIHVASPYILTQFPLMQIISWDLSFSLCKKKDRKKTRRRFNFLCVSPDISCPYFVISHWRNSRQEHRNKNARTGQWHFLFGTITHWIFWDKLFLKCLWIRFHKNRAEKKNERKNKLRESNIMHASRQTVVTAMDSFCLNLSFLNYGFHWLGFILSLVRASFSLSQWRLLFL